MWRILQQEGPGDFVLATGESHSVREFCELAFQEAGIELEWRGSGTSEEGVVKSTSFRASDQGNKVPQPGDKIMAIDPRYFRPTEVGYLLGDASKARQELGWEPTVTFKQLVKVMVKADIQDLQNLQRCQDVIEQIMNNSSKP
jgi:GDPmannose 4,6-dehydratase